MLTQRSANPRLQFDELKVAAHQFQSAVGSELLVSELDRKLLLDRLPQPPYLQPHLWGLRVVPSCVTAALQMTRQRPLFFDQIVESTRIIFGSRLNCHFLADADVPRLTNSFLSRPTRSLVAPGIVELAFGGLLAQGIELGRQMFELEFGAQLDQLHCATSSYTASSRRSTVKACSHRMR